MLRHVVFFKFKDGIGEEEIVDLEKSFAALPPAVRLRRAEYQDVIPEPASGGYPESRFPPSRE